MKECEEFDLTQVCKKKKKILKCEIEKCKSNLNSECESERSSSNSSDENRYDKNINKPQANNNDPNSLIDVNRYENEFKQLNGHLNADCVIKKVNILLPEIKKSIPNDRNSIASSTVLNGLNLHNLNNLTMLQYNIALNAIQLNSQLNNHFISTANQLNYPMHQLNDKLLVDNNCQIKSMYKMTNDSNNDQFSKLTNNSVTNLTNSLASSLTSNLTNNNSSNTTPVNASIINLATNLQNNLPIISSLPTKYSINSLISNQLNNNSSVFLNKNDILPASNQPIDLTNKQANEDQINHSIKLLDYWKHCNHSTDLIANQNGFIENNLIESNNLMQSNNQINSFNSEVFQLNNQTSDEKNKIKDKRERNRFVILKNS